MLPGTGSKEFFETLLRPEWSDLRSAGGYAVANCSVPGPDTAANAARALATGRRAPANRDAGPSLLTLATNAKISTAYSGPAQLPGGASALSTGAGLRARVEAPASEIPTWTLTAGQLLQGARLIVLELPQGGTSASALTIAGMLAANLDAERDLLILTSPDPGTPAGGQWQDLAPVLLWGSGWRDRVAASGTTRTPGLLANTDLTPTLLAHLGVPLPAPVEGHAASPRPGSLRELLAFAAGERATHAAMVPGLLAWGVFDFLVVLLASVTLLRGLPRPYPQLSRLLIGAMAAFPLAMLLAAVVPAGSAVEVLVRIGVLAVVLTAVAALLSPNGTPLPWILFLTYAAIVVDLLFVHRMLARNLMSDFANIGARFYGMGNEYEGLFLGAAVLCPFFLADSRGDPAPRGWIAAAAAALWIGALVFVGAPELGSDFGGALSFGIAFLFAAALARAAATGGRLSLPGAAAGLAAVVVLGAGLVALDLRGPAGQRTHVGELAARALHGDLATVGETLARKAWTNVEMAMVPYFWVSLLAVLPVFWLWYDKLGPEARAAFLDRPALRCGIAAALVGGVACLLLNDTGVVAWALATGCGLLAGLDLLLERQIAGEGAPRPPRRAEN